MPYTISIAPSAAKQLRALPSKVQQAVGKKIDPLKNAPRSRRTEKLEGAEDLDRIRSGDYRIIYQIRDEILTIMVVKIGDRKEVYRNFGDL